MWRRKMAPMFDWLHSAVGKFREFAYAEEKRRGGRPRVGLGRFGPFARRLRGSCAYPGCSVPIEYEGRKLVDGFLTAPVPVEGAALLGADIVIAIYLEAGSVSEPRTVADVISRSFTIIQRHADIGWRQSADVIIEPEVKHFVWDDFSKWADLIAAGEVAAARALPKIREALAEKVEERVS